MCQAYRLKLCNFRGENSWKNLCKTEEIVSKMKKCWWKRDGGTSRFIHKLERDIQGLKEKRQPPGTRFQARRSQQMQIVVRAGVVLPPKSRGTPSFCHLLKETSLVAAALPRKSVAFACKHQQWKDFAATTLAVSALFSISASRIPQAFCPFAPGFER